MISEVVIREAVPADAPAVAQFCQPIYAATYPNAKYGMKPEHFSPEIFALPDTTAYFASILDNSAQQCAYIAEQEGHIVGTIGVRKDEAAYHFQGFYVALSAQGQGIGGQLFRRALEFCKNDRPIILEIAETNTRAMAMYKHWGFQPAPELGLNLRHWPEWPEGLQNGYIFMKAHKNDLRV